MSIALWASPLGVAGLKRPVVAAAMALAGCSKPDADLGSPSSRTPFPVASAAMSPLASPSAAAATPHMKEYADPPADPVGVLAPGTGIPVGQKVPDVHARDLEGKDVSLASLYTRGPILLTFYRGGWCPYCSSENHALAMAYPAYQKRAVTPGRRTRFGMRATKCASTGWR